MNSARTPRPPLWLDALSLALLVGGILWLCPSPPFLLRLTPVSVGLGCAMGALMLALRRVRRRQGPGGFLATEGLAALWAGLSWGAVDAVLPDPLALRGEVGEQEGGVQGRIVGQSPDRPGPLLAGNDLLYAEQCRAFDEENASLLQARARWAARLQSPPRYLGAVLGSVLWLGVSAPLVSLLVLLGHTRPLSLPLLLVGCTSLLLVGTVLLVLLYGLLSAVVGALSWLRALVLSGQAERDRAQAMRQDAARRASAAGLLVDMRARGEAG